MRLPKQFCIKESFIIFYNFLVNNGYKIIYKCFAHNFVIPKVLEMSPIEVAIDEMESRVKELLEIVKKEPTDIKKLQLKLQVSSYSLFMESLFMIPVSHN